MTATSPETSPTKPQPAVLSTESHLQPEPMSNIDLERGTRNPNRNSEFDPCSNAHFTSPFYDHDTPRVSSDFVKNKTATVQLYALPTQTSSTSTLKKKTKKKQPCMTKPRQRSRWWARLSKKQKLALKLLLAVVLVGAIVGLAVGITKRVGGGVVKSNNQVSNIS
jgi:hypothetical protein